MARPTGRIGFWVEDRRLNKKTLKKELKARKAEAKTELAAQRTALRAELRSRRRAAANLRGRLVLLAVLILLWACLRSCDCSQPPSPPAPPLPPPVTPVDEAPEPENPEPELETAKKKPKAKPKKKKRYTGRIKPRDRARFTIKEPDRQTWLTSFRLQVGARSPRLAECFEGVDNPGAIKWSATMDITKGLVSDHVFEPALQGHGLSKIQKACLATVLSTPVYGFPKPTKGLTTSRVSMVIEF